MVLSASTSEPRDSVTHAVVAETEKFSEVAGREFGEWIQLLACKATEHWFKPRSGSVYSRQIGLIS